MKPIPERTSLRIPEEFQLMVHLGMATLFLFMGGTLTLNALGIVQGDASMGWGARIVAFLFGGLITVVGAGVAAIPLLALAKAQGVARWWSIVALVVRKLAARTTRDSALAAALMLPLIWGYWRASRGADSWLFPRDGLIALVVIEFLLIHGFVFLAIAALFAKGPERGSRLGGRIAIGAFMLLYLTFAFQAGGIYGVVGLCYLVSPNVLAFLHPGEGWSVRGLAASRWAWKFVTLVGSAMLLNERTLEGSGNLRLGLFYFAVQALGELVRVAELPFDLSAAWARLPPSSRKPLITLQSRES